MATSLYLGPFLGVLSPTPSNNVASYSKSLQSLATLLAIIRSYPYPADILHRILRTCFVMPRVSFGYPLCSYICVVYDSRFPR